MNATELIAKQFPNRIPPTEQLAPTPRTDAELYRLVHNLPKLDSESLRLAVDTPCCDCRDEFEK